MLTRTQSRVKPAVSAGVDPAHPLTCGLAACWPFNEGAGASVRDTGGYRHDGSVSGNPIWSAGSFGRAIEFDGNDDWISMGDCLDLGTDDVSLLAIVKYSAANQPDDWNGNHIAAVAGKGYLSGGGKGYGLLIGTSNQMYWQIRNQATEFSVASNAALNDGRWHLVIGVCDRDDPAGVRLYVDSVRQNATANATSLGGIDLSGSRAFAIGSRQDETSGTWFWDFAGGVAMVCVWKRVLADGEIRRLQHDPFAILAPQRCTAVLAHSAGGIVPCAGSIGAVTSASATARVTRNVAGMAAASASLHATLTAAGQISVSATAYGRSTVNGTLSTAAPKPVFQAMLQTETTWQREALFNGATHAAIKLGTVLTQGWFWVRRRGCTAVYRGTSLTQVDFSRILYVAEPAAHELSLPAYLSHAPGSTHCYLVRRFNSCGHQEKTAAAATVLRVAPDGQLAPHRPNAVLGLAVGQTDPACVRLIWFYCPLDQKAAPDRFNLYASDPNGQIDFEHPIGTVRYGGRRFYCFDIPGLTAGKHTFAVRAASANGIEDGSSASVVRRIAVSPPQPAVILTAQPI